MSNTSQAPREQRTSLFRRFLRMLRHHLGFKIIALLLALLLWAGLITQDPNLTRERTFTDVNVTISGSESLQRNGFIVTSDLSEVLGDVTLRVAVPQMQYQTAAATNYNARIDLSRITEPGTQSVRILTANTNTYGTVLEVTPSEVEITVEEYITRYRIPVRVNPAGHTPDGYYATAPTADPPMVTVSGPRSLVKRIVCAEATLELANLPAREGNNRTALPFDLLDADNEIIQSNLLEITSESVLLDSVVVEQQLYSLKSIPLSDIGLIRGAPADGYEIKSITITPDTITVAGAADVLAELDALYPDTYLDISGLTDSTNHEVRLREPGALAYYSTNTVTVAVEVGPMMQTTSFDGIRLGIENVATGLDAELGTKFASVNITGPKLWLQRIGKNSVSLYCDASGLSEGVYQLPVLCSVSGSEGQEFNVEVTPLTIEVFLTAK